jgi:hypothetical protein
MAVPDKLCSAAGAVSRRSHAKLGDGDTPSPTPTGRHPGFDEWFARKAGATNTFELDVAIHGWCGSAIGRALGAYAADAAGQATPRSRSTMAEGLPPAVPRRSSPGSATTA